MTDPKSESEKCRMCGNKDGYGSFDRDLDNPGYYCSKCGEPEHRIESETKEGLPPCAECGSPRESGLCYHADSCRYKPLVAEPPSSLCPKCHKVHGEYEVNGSDGYVGSWCPNVEYQLYAPPSSLGQESAELKPCPFCGGEPKLAQVHEGEWEASCRNLNCYALIERIKKEDAIANWNARFVAAPVRQAEQRDMTPEEALAEARKIWAYSAFVSMETDTRGKLVCSIGWSNDEDSAVCGVGQTFRQAFANSDKEAGK